MAYRVAILTISDKGFAGLREDRSGPAIQEMLGAEFVVVHQAIVPDDFATISRELADIADRQLAELVITSGGTGLSPRDVTPEATKAVLERDLPGIPEIIRLNTWRLNRRSVLSRAVAGTRNQTLIINLPGSPQGVRECLAVVREVIGHALEILSGRGEECATPDHIPRNGQKHS
ncbi:MAG: MogA/MoaB family molybdenum cofactor biosynthesis protein [Negativicutes bacterium]|nr:MogA/MoaB family molybdenum cofactor biosynthesis protein [Negativicutes bacterium]